MRKIYLQNHNQFRRLYHKFYNLQRRLRELIQTGEFYSFSTEMRNRLIRRLKLLYERLSRTSSKQRIKWATAAMALILSASIAKAGFTEPVNLSGFTFTYYSSSAIVDLDLDGDLDAVIGDQSGTITYYENDGQGFNQLTGTNNPFYGIDTLYYVTPAFGDVDEDGDLDLVTGHSNGIIFYYQNDAGVFTQISGAGNPFEGIDLGYQIDPTLADVDADGDLDLVIGQGYGIINYFRNDEGTYTQLLNAENPFDDIYVGYEASPSFADFDDDGDLDLFVGNWYGYIEYYQNDAGTFVDQGTNNPFYDRYFGTWVDPTMVDVDGDNDIDLTFNNANPGFIHYIRNDATAFNEMRGTQNPFEGVLVEGSAQPVFADVVGDTDLELIVGSEDGTIALYSDTLDAFIPLEDADNPFDGITIGNGEAAPSLGDLDGDGDLDLLVGDGYGYVSFFENTAGVYTENAAENPFDGIDFGTAAIPAMVDFDNDADLDVFIAQKYGTIVHYMNDAGTFVLQTGSDTPIDTVDYDITGLDFIDYDEDGDVDLFIGEKYGSIPYFENIGDTLIEQTGMDNPAYGIDLSYSAPVMVDADDDGDLDLYVGTSVGKMYFSEFIPGGISVNPASGLVTTEAGGTAQFSVVLDARPKDDVVIELTSSSIAEGTVDPATLTFTPSDWDVPQTVTLTGVDDSDDDGNQNYTVSFAVTSADPEYDGLNIADVTVSNTDDDGPDGINPSIAETINVYGVNHTIMIVSNGRIIDKVNVFDMTGQLVYETAIGASGTQEIIIPDAHDGIYIVQTASEGEVLKTKVILY